MIEKVESKKINKGNEAEIVYITINILARMRSGWPPQPKINSIIGINLNSKVIYNKTKELLLKKMARTNLRTKIAKIINLELN